MPVGALKEAIEDKDIVKFSNLWESLSPDVVEMLLNDRSDGSLAAMADFHSMLKSYLKPLFHKAFFISRNNFNAYVKRDYSRLFVSIKQFDRYTQEGFFKLYENYISEFITEIITAEMAPLWVNNVCILILECKIDKSNPKDQLSREQTLRADAIQFLIKKAFELNFIYHPVLRKSKTNDLYKFLEALIDNGWEKYFPELNQDELKKIFMGSLEIGSLVILNFAALKIEDREDNLFFNDDIGTKLAQVIHGGPSTILSQKIDLITTHLSEKIYLASKLSPKTICNNFGLFNFIINESTQAEIVLRLYEQSDLDKILQCTINLKENALSKLRDVLIENNKFSLFYHCFINLSLDNRKKWLAEHENENYTLLAKETMKRGIKDYAESLYKYVNLFKVNKDLFNQMLIEVLNHPEEVENVNLLSRIAGLLKNYTPRIAGHQECLQSTLKIIIDANLFFNNPDNAPESAPNFYSAVLNNAQTLALIADFLPNPIFLKRMLLEVFKLTIRLDQLELFIGSAIEFINDALLTSRIDENKPLTVIEHICNFLSQCAWGSCKLIPSNLLRFLSSPIMTSYLIKKITTLFPVAENEPLDDGAIYLYLKIVSGLSGDMKENCIKQLYSSFPDCMDYLFSYLKQTKNYYVFIGLMSDEKFSNLIINNSDAAAFSKLFLNDQLLKRKSVEVLNTYLQSTLFKVEKIDSQFILDVFNLKNSEGNPLIKVLLSFSKTSQLTLETLIWSCWRENYLITLKNLFKIDEFLIVLLNLPENHFIFTWQGDSIHKGNREAIATLFYDILENLPLHHFNYDLFFHRLLNASQYHHNNEQFKKTIIEMHCKKLLLALSTYSIQDDQFTNTLNELLHFIKTYQQARLLNQVVKTVNEIQGIANNPNIADLLQKALEDLRKLTPEQKSLPQSTPNKQSEPSRQPPTSNKSNATTFTHSSIFHETEKSLSQLTLISQPIERLRQQYPSSKSEFQTLPADVASTLIFDNILEYLHSKHEGAIRAKIKAKEAMARYDERVDHYQKIHNHITSILQNNSRAPNLNESLTAFVEALTYPKTSSYFGISTSDDNYKKYIQALLVTPTPVLITRFNEMVKKLNRLAQKERPRPHVITLDNISKNYCASLPTLEAAGQGVSVNNNSESGNNNNNNNDNERSRSPQNLQ